MIAYKVNGKMRINARLLEAAQNDREDGSVHVKNVSIRVKKSRLILRLYESASWSQSRGKRGEKLERTTERNPSTAESNTNIQTVAHIQKFVKSTYIGCLGWICRGRASGSAVISGADRAWSIFLLRCGIWWYYPGFRGTLGMHTAH